MAKFFGKQNSPEDFWNWFVKNKDDYKALNLIEDQNERNKIINALGIQLDKYCKHLTWEIGNDPNSDQELIITAEGKIEYFDKVRAIVSSAPKINGWQIIAFKPPIPGNFISKWKDSIIETKEIAFEATYLKETQELAITVYLQNYNSLKNCDSLNAQVNKMIDTIIGEESFATDIHYFDLEPVPDDTHFEDYENILDLPNCINWFKEERQKNSR
jgi:hypothetical protein